MKIILIVTTRWRFVIHLRHGAIILCVDLLKKKIIVSASLIVDAVSWVCLRAVNPYIEIIKGSYIKVQDFTIIPRLYLSVLW